MKVNFEISNRSVLSFLTLMALIVLGWAYAEQLFFSLEEVYYQKTGEIQINNLGLVWVPMIVFLLFAVMTCLAVNIFKKLKKYRERGLLFFLMICLMISIIIGLISVFVSVMIAVFFFNRPFDDIIVIFVVGLTCTFITGLGSGLLLGLPREFKNS